MRRVAEQIEYVPPQCVPTLPPCNPRLAEAYVLYQVYTSTFTPSESLCAGTIFPELYRPYAVSVLPEGVRPCP